MSGYILSEDELLLKNTVRDLRGQGDCATRCGV